MTSSATRDSPPKRKRLLSIDGGGLRGIIAAQVLVRLESLLEEKTGTGRLAEHFHLIGGTSTGAILAAGLARGMSAGELLDFYVRYGAAMFRKELPPLCFWNRYLRLPLARKLREVFQDIKLGGEEVKTLLMIVCKNATTGSPWFFINNPENPYYASNSRLPLWQIVRASTAAPTYFPPERIPVLDRAGKPKTFEFIDGGVSMFNNPSFQLFLEASHPNYHLNWPAGVDNLLLLSIGTGFAPVRLPLGAATRKTLVGWGSYAIEVLMDDANLQQNILLQLIGHTPRPEYFDRELGTGTPEGKSLRELVAPFWREKLLTYQRYTVEFSPDRMRELGLKNIDCKEVRKLDAVDEIDNLVRIGRAVADEQVQWEDFAEFFS